jgi:hypothetical protein
MARDPGDVIDPETGKVRVLSESCTTCIFRAGNLMHLPAGKVDEVIEANLRADALLTCHATLPYGDNPDFGPAVCAGFWAKHGQQTVAGRIAVSMIGIVKVDPPVKEE